MSVAPFDHRVLSGLLGDPVLAALFTVEAELEAMLRFELALARAEEAVALLPPGTGDALEKAIGGFEPDRNALKAATARDGVCIPELVRQWRAAAGDDLGPCLHVGATSQDVVDTALVLRLKPALDEIEVRLERLLAGFDDMAARFGDRTIMAHTRMKRALPLRCAERIARWRKPLAGLLADMPSLRARLLRLQFGGAVGTLDRLGDKAAAVSAALAGALGLEDAGCWHDDRAPFADYAAWLARLSGALGKFGQDVALLAQDEVAAIRLKGGGGSSAMPHKRNPVAAEALVTLARFNATLVGAMHQALVHENERSGAAWTLEWMVLPQMTVAAGTGLRLAVELVDAIEEIG